MEDQFWEIFAIKLKCAASTFWSPDLSIYGRGTIVFSGVRPSVRVSGLLPDNRSLLFSEIWQQTVFSYVDVHYKKNFQGKTFIAAPGVQKWLKTPKNAPKWAKMTLFPS